MAVFALNYAHATGVATLSVEPVCLADAGIQVFIGKHLQLSVQGDVKDLVHRLALASRNLFENFPAEGLNVHVCLDRHCLALLDVAAHRKVCYVGWVSFECCNRLIYSAEPLLQQPGAGSGGFANHLITHFKN
jgi:hypothetical protein